MDDSMEAIAALALAAGVDYQTMSKALRSLNWEQQMTVAANLTAQAKGKIKSQLNK